MTLMDLKKKAAYYKIKEEWVKDFEPIPIISTTAYGNLAAVKVCEELKVQSPKDKHLLGVAKEKVYKEGFYSGKMILGDFAGKPVQEAKPLIRQQLIEKNQAIPYWEPEGLVMSRSGDECVVCLTDQWYLNYGEDSWKEAALNCLNKMNLFHDEVKNNFLRTLDWLREWACSRSFGLGSRLPWDEQWLIESLSDSTIYMAYYTIAHLLQGGGLDGSAPGLAKLTPEQLTDEVWDYIFTAPKKSAPPTNTKVPADTLKRIKTEFEYFYPLDLRVSGKDLISNHLSFFIYNHVAIFREENWPQGIRANGHVMINNMKMSKSTGNFLTLSEAVDRFSADATRFTLAESGDSVEDANFEMDIANVTILKLFTLKEWIEATMKDVQAGKLREGPVDQFNDRVFENDLRRLVKAADQAYAG
jgi:leucyl-tRNA synthetase